MRSAVRSGGSRIRWLGIAELIISAMVEQGVDEKAARSRIFMVDKQGLLVEGSENLRDFRRAWFRAAAPSQHGR